MLEGISGNLQNLLLFIRNASKKYNDFLSRMLGLKIEGLETT